MTEEEIEKEAKEYSQGNFYSEQGFLYGYERGFAESRKETFSEEVIKNLKENTSVINSVIINKLSEKCEQLEKENEDLKNKNFVVTQLYNNSLAENKGLKDIIIELRKENKQLQTRSHIVPEHYLTEALDKCQELERKNAEQNEIIHELHKPPLYDGYSLQLKNEEQKAFCTKLIKANNELREKFTKI